MAHEMKDRQRLPKWMKMKMPKENALDKLIRVVAPGRAMRRMEARLKMSAAETTFRGASRSAKSMKQWKVRSGSQDEDYQYDMPTIRTRCRDLELNNPMAKAAINNAAMYIVGSGPTLNAQINNGFLGMSRDQKIQSERDIQREWNLYSDTVEFDYERVKKFKGACWHVVFNAFLSGDVFDNMVSLERPGSPYRLKHQFIEADVCDEHEFV